MGAWSKSNKITLLPLEWLLCTTSQWRVRHHRSTCFQSSHGVQISIKTMYKWCVKAKLSSGRDPYGFSTWHKSTFHMVTIWRPRFQEMALRYGNLWTCAKYYYKRARNGVLLMARKCHFNMTRGFLISKEHWHYLNPLVLLFSGLVKLSTPLMTHGILYCYLSFFQMMRWSAF